MKRLLRRQASHGREIDADPVESEDEQRQLPTEYARGSTNSNRDEEQAHQSVPETRGRGGDDHGFGGSGYLGTDADEEANAYEGEGQPLLREEVAGYINVDFRDGTGPSALPPNDVARAFREAEDFAPVGRGAKFWAEISGVDGVHHPGRVGGVQGGGRAGSGRRGGATVGRTRVVHVESATTGKFFKVYEGVGGAATTGAWFLPGSGNQTGDGLGVDGRNRGHGGGGGGGGGGGREGIAEDKAATAERLGISVREVSIMRLDKGLEAGVLLVQGILAGLTLASLYAVLLGDSLESFIAAYEAQAGEWRRAMFLLCTLALAGTEDQLFKAKGKREVWQTLTWSGRLEHRACVFLYGGCLVSTLVCAVADTVIANANGSPSDSWYTSALEEPSFRRKIHIWYGFNLARFLFAWAGWFLVCRRGWRASLLGDQSQMELKGQRDKLSAANEQISHLNGRSLDPLTTKELQELRGALKKALNNTERQIDLR